jgi:hypothetical protein
VELASDPLWAPSDPDPTDGFPPALVEQPMEKRIPVASDAQTDTAFPVSRCMDPQA